MRKSRRGGRISGRVLEKLSAVGLKDGLFTALTKAYERPSVVRPRPDKVGDVRVLPVDYVRTKKSGSRQEEGFTVDRARTVRRARVMRPSLASSPVPVRECVQRQQRKEVLHAKKVAGRKGGSPGRKRQDGKKYRRKPSSNFSC